MSALYEVLLRVLMSLAVIAGVVSIWALLGVFLAMVAEVRA